MNPGPLANQLEEDIGSHADASDADPNQSVRQAFAPGSASARASIVSRSELKTVSIDDVAQSDASPATGANDTIADDANKKYLQALVQAKQFQLLASKQSAIIQLFAHYLDQTNLHAGLVALSEELHQQFSCERVVVGLADRGVVKVACISQQPGFDPRSGEVALLNDVLQEACDQDVQIHFANDTDILRHDLTVVEAHRALLSGIRSAQVCTVPMCYQGKVIGALMLEIHNAEPWSNITLDLFKQIASFSAPLIGLREAGFTYHSLGCIVSVRCSGATQDPGNGRASLCRKAFNYGAIE